MALITKRQGLGLALATVFALAVHAGLYYVSEKVRPKPEDAPAVPAEKAKDPAP